MYRPGTGYTALVQLTRPPPQLVTESSDQVHSTLDSGAGRQQVSTNMASTDWLQSLQITRPVYWLYSLIFTKTGCRVITSTTGYRACRQGTGYTTLLHQNRLQSLWTSSCLNSWVTPAYQFCQLQRITGYRKLPVTETWYLSELPKIILFTENS